MQGVFLNMLSATNQGNYKSRLQAELYIKIVKVRYIVILKRARDISLEHADVRRED